MDLHEALYTTRAMRRVAPDPIPDEVMARIFDAAIRAPSGGNTQKWRFVVVTDPAVKATVQGWYRAGLTELNATQYASVMDQIATGDPDDPGVAQSKRINSSAEWLADNLDQVPALVFAFGKPNGESSVFPAVWSLCLAARAEGIGTVITTLLGKYVKNELEELLGVPRTGEWHMMAMIPMGFPTGKWGIAARTPAHEVVYANHWDTPIGWTVDEPLWSAS
jgi:nitroreductase